MITMAPATAFVPGRATQRTWSLAAALRTQLDDLDHNPRALLVLRGWGTAEPVLAGIGSFEELRRLAHDNGDHEKVDQVLLALARMASIYGTGDALAAQALLALLHTGLAAWRRRLSPFDHGNADEIEQALAAELAVRIRTWRGERAVAANLLRSASRDVRTRMQREQTLPTTSTTRVPYDQDLDTRACTDRAAADPAAHGSEHDVNDLLRWVVRTGLLTAAEADPIHARRVLGFSTTELANAAGVAHKTLQRRCQRAEQRLRGAVSAWANAR